MDVPGEEPSLDERLISAIESIAESLAALVEEVGGININTGEDSALIKTLNDISDSLDKISDHIEELED